MRKIVVVFAMCLVAMTIKAQTLTVNEQIFDSLSADSKAYIASLGSVTQKGTVTTIQADSITKITLIKGIKSRELDTAGVAKIEDQYLVVYKTKDGKECGFLTTELPSTDAVKLIGVMKDPGLKQGDDEFPEYLNF